MDYFEGSDPHRGDIVHDHVPLAPLKNVGKAILNPSTCKQTPAAKKAIDALNSEAFMISDIIDDKKMKSLVTTKAKECKYPAHIAQMLDEGNRKEVRNSVLKKLPIGCDATLYAAYFAVLKELEEARAIFDARIFNACCNRPPDFDIATLTQLLDALTSFGTSKIFFYSADLTNMFYQLKIKQHLGMMMGLMMKGRTMIPRVLPMGWSWSCWIAQAITWSLIFFCLEGDETLGIPKEDTESERPQGMVRCEDGTCIFVIYDTILVFGVEEAVGAWKKRIERNMANAHLLLKYSILGRTADFNGLRLESSDRRQRVLFPKQTHSNRRSHHSVACGARHCAVRCYPCVPRDWPHSQWHV